MMKKILVTRKLLKENEDKYKINIIAINSDTKFNLASFEMIK